MATPSMLPFTYQLPAGVLLMVGGAVACFFGHRLFKFVLAIFGFILGAFAATSVFNSPSMSAWLMVLIAIGGGMAGALLLLAAYFVGVALVGAGIGALVANLIWTQIEGDPHPFVVVLFSVAGALLATWLQRYVIILGTAFAGAWTMLVGGLALMGYTTALDAAAAGDVWVLYPTAPAPGQPWVPYAWVALGVIGAAIQMFVTGGERGRLIKANKRRKASE